MKVISSTTTVAAYFDEIEESKVTVNNDYQRSSKVWPTKARSYLVDTILHGFPIPKLSLYQTTDLKSRKTVKEIVDGQQRSMTIVAFMKDEFRISGNSKFAGKTYSKLDEETQSTFLEYQLSLDIFIGATEDDIRQTFRRINSYNVPLNPPELRHATFQGEFKWFIVRLLDKFSQVLKSIGTYNESQLGRMKDANLFAEIIMATHQGIESASDKKIDIFYERNEDEFNNAGLYESLFDKAFALILGWQSLHDGPLVKPYNLYALLLAIFHRLHAFEALKPLIDEPLFDKKIIDAYESEVVLGELADSLLQDNETASYRKYEEFIKANSRCNKSCESKEYYVQVFLQFVKIVKTYRYLNRLDDSFSQHMRNIEYNLRLAIKQDSLWFEKMIFPYAIIQMTNTWSSFIKNYYLSCVISTESRTGLKVNSSVTNDVNQALGLIIKYYKRSAAVKADGTWHRRDEPAWHDYNVILTGASLLNFSNLHDINSAFSSRNRVFSDLPVFRNFFAHKNEGTKIAAQQLALQYGIPSILRPNQILMQKAIRRPQELIFDWIDDLVFTANYLCY